MEPIDFSEIFHHSSKDHLPISADSSEWPEEWKTTYYKTYPRLPKIILEDEPPQADFFDLIKKRKSQRDFSRAPVTKRELSLILKYSCGNTGAMGEDRHRRAHPSGGARFPAEVYPIVFRPEGDLVAGLYHYNVKEHALDVLWGREFDAGEIGNLFTYPWVKDAALVLVITAVFWRSQNKYGERGYRYALTEAGHIGQNAYLVSEALGLKCCALGGTRDAALEKLIDIDGVTESVIYALAVGK
ncbi:MAG: SagB/ThcOx family dehydrogenase [bacterium]|nr:SagB/ThcOx family dehydrogenase [bacterium]